MSAKCSQFAQMFFVFEIYSTTVALQETQRQVSQMLIFPHINSFERRSRRLSVTQLRHARNTRLFFRTRIMIMNNISVMFLCDFTCCRKKGFNLLFFFSYHTVVILGQAVFANRTTFSCYELIFLCLSVL